MTATGFTDVDDLLQRTPSMSGSLIDTTTNNGGIGSVLVDLRGMGTDRTVTMTYTLCTIPEPEKALTEIRRVLKPDGRLLFCEHGRAPDEHVRRWQDRLNPVWGKLSGGCNLNRPIAGLLEVAGFSLEDLQTMYIPGWKPACFNYWGSAGYRL